MKVKIDNVTFDYGNGVRIFENFFFENKSSLVLFKGRSGCGKTTLLNLLFGTLKPSKGEIKFSIKNPKKYMITQDIGLFPWLTGTENILLNKNLTKKDITSHSLYFLVEEHIEKKCFEMSFGQRRKVELLRAFLSQSDFYLFDEPLNFIDKDSRKLISDYIKELSKERLVIITSHYEEEIRDFGGEVYEFGDIFPIERLENVKIN
ncbi:NitT/TauT family transport system ATP-binding protein [Thermotomaculum hydrothermale]|uniref:NitT/TauT family transport system ATP-binding protein n=1 Tax=Thermotomaculum hydrothermale TaxID=981385 RepID=A0A7R6PZG2_9BACT|nr:ATP-binding cassette domain-containing protein [Thermotomaculum hydrothermale]BBB32578.1 NitT/TauT family transport system ATP-binding protein [Thermotomaculum hydrothermale]